MQLREYLSKKFPVFQGYRLASLTIAFLFAGVILFAVLSIGIGAVTIHPTEVIRVLWSQIGDSLAEDELVMSSAIVLNIRVPRVIMAILIGAALAISGAALQGLFRNPLADPGLIGVSGGSAFAAALVIIFGPQLADFFPAVIQNILLPVVAFIGGLIATFTVYNVASFKGKTSVSTMLLAGIAINALASAGIGYLIFSADDNQIRDLAFWTLGSLSGVTWDSVFSAGPFLLISIISLPFLSKKMNVMLLGESEARYLGIRVERVKKAVVFLSALGVGAAVAVSGIIGFVGLVVPHLLRLIIGPDHRFLMPASILLGAVLLLGSDLVARMAVIPAELPIGVITSTVGAPFFLWLLIKNRTSTSFV